MWFIQMIESAKDAAEAQQMLDALRLQVGFRGGRVLPKTHDGRPDRAQAFFDDDGKRSDIAFYMDEWLPDGLRRVFISDGVRKTLGIE